MQVVYPRCCGLDIHKKLIVACVLVSTEAGTSQATTKTFGAMTDDLERLGGWLTEQGVTHVAMESTGVYWQPVYNILEDRFTLLLVNAQHVKAVPGRKTDVQDAAWLAQLLRHGLLRGSVVPDREQRELRELSRYRSALVRDRATVVHRIHKTLEGANLKLSAVVTDLQGRSAQAILQALAAGTTDPVALADLARGKLRPKRPELTRALTGRVRPHQQFLLTEQLALLEALDERIERASQAIAARLHPFEPLLDRLDAVPGIGRWTAEALLAEFGTDLTRFPTAKHLAAWAGVAPGNRESAGKRRPSPARPGNRWVRTLLVEAGRAAGRTTRSSLGAKYRRLAARRGANRAAVAIAHRLVVIVYHLLTTGATYTDLGSADRDPSDRDQTVRRAVARIERLGYQVTLSPIEPAA
jgi:transposase